MDRKQFLHSIKSEDLEVSDIVVNFFDQYMILYDLIDNVKSTSIISSSISDISFQLDFDDEQSVIIMRDKLVTIPAVMIFESYYNILFEILSKQSILIKFLK